MSALLTLEARQFLAACEVQVDDFQDKHAAQEFIAGILAGNELALEGVKS